MSGRNGEPPPGPWSDPPAAVPPPWRVRGVSWRPQAPRRAREPLVNNWRGLLIVVFLLFLAPPLAVWVAHLIMGAAAP